jgi:FkbM family methyltransferase
MKITYGIVGNTIDVTEICYSKLLKNDVITIPCGDHNRAFFFTDPLNGILKKVFITNDDTIETEYDHTQTVKINVIDKSITIINQESITNKLANIHSNLKIMYGGFHDEVPEQRMAVRYLTGTEKVLEIGGNIGRNSLVIASILGNNSKNFVTMESDADIAEQLRMNRTLNNLDFHIESSALSKKKMIQKSWDTIHSDVLLDGYKNVNIISLEGLNTKYNIAFDTLVLDCEGAFYYILQDMPEILNGIKLIIMENDYRNINHKEYVDEVLRKNKFYVDYVESGGWGPCYNNFFEVWKKNSF